MISTLLKIFIYMGIGVLALSLVQYQIFLKKLKNSIDKISYFHIYSILIISFIMGYLYLALKIESIQLVYTKVLITAILFFGSIFVFIATSLLNHMYREIIKIKIAETDSMTNLLTKKAGLHLAQELINKPSNMYLMMIDIDNFKQINDNFGHIEGNKVIFGISYILKTHSLKHSVVSRYGGDEFMIFGSYANVDEIINSVNNMINGINSFNSNVTCSIGIALKSKERNVDDLLLKADKALYYIKNSGKNNYKLYSGEN